MPARKQPEHYQRPEQEPEVASEVATTTATAYLEPPTKDALTDAGRTIRRWTTALRPGGIVIRWGNLDPGEKQRLVELTDRRERTSEWWQLVDRASGKEAA